jgi:AbrB family looped-hinge helix DNA binding protein
MSRTTTRLAKLTSKGQITVPREVRRALGVRAGDRLQFQKDGDSFRVSPVRGESPFEKYRGIGVGGIGRGRKAVIRAVRKLRGR